MILFLNTDTHIFLYNSQIGKAAELAGVSFAQMKDIFAQQGIKPELGSETIEEAKQEYETLQRHFNEEQKK